MINIATVLCQECYQYWPSVSQRTCARCGETLKITCNFCFKACYVSKKDGLCKCNECSMKLALQNE